jgi:prepilin peptidase CpaA
MADTLRIERYLSPMFHDVSQQASLYLLPALMIVAAVKDCASYRIPNWLTGLTAVLFFPLAWATGMPLAEFGWHLLAGAVLFVAGYGLFAAGLFGGGDAKLMAAAGLWFGTSHTMSFLVMTALAGGVVAAVFTAWSVISFSWDVKGGDGTRGLRERLRQFAPKLPYGLALAVGAILAFPQTWWAHVA